ncbi:MAG: capsule assembly Wzi family protein [Sedimentisphaerales bacterium]|nr:capsule assembly Wzi family protein [Sedimentisphaerales bacterium]
MLGRHMDGKPNRISLALIPVLIWATAGPCLGTASVNVPLWHWSYQHLERLVDYGLIDSAMLATRPISRIEMARLIQQVLEDPKLSALDGSLKASIKRLQEEFRCELETLASPRLPGQVDYIKPIEDPYLEVLHGDNDFDLENRAGDVFESGTNLRMGFVSRATLFERFAFSIHPEYRNPWHTDTSIELVDGYAKSQIGPIEIELGRDALWWGPGHHGSLILSNNARNLGMLKVSTPEPIQLPWPLQGLGPFKAVYFLTRLESDRDHPNARLTGLRMSIKPRPWLELGGSRTIIFGGEGVPGVGLDDYLAIFWPKNIQGYEDQRASLDATIWLTMPSQVPFRSIKTYIEWAGEDADGFSKYVPLVGLKLNDIGRLGNTDLRLEYATTHVKDFPNVFYNHGFYYSGYTYHGRVLGHHMGTDAQDMFVRIDHYLTNTLQLGLAYDWQESNLSGKSRPTSQQYGIDLLWFAPRNWQVFAGYRWQEDRSDGLTERRHILDIAVVYNF